MREGLPGLPADRLSLACTHYATNKTERYETEDPRRMLRQVTDEVEVDQKFRQLVTNAAPAIVLSKENPLTNELLSSDISASFREG